MPSGVTGGWKLDFENKYRQEMFSIGNVIKEGFVSPVQFDNKAAKKFIQYYADHYDFYTICMNLIKDMEMVKEEQDEPVAGEVKTYGQIKTIDHLITEQEAEMFFEVFSSSSKLNANVHGRLDEMNTENTGSERVSWYNVQLADMIFQRLNGIVEQLVVSDNHAIPGEDNAIYRAVGINPLMRFISLLS